MHNATSIIKSFDCECTANLADAVAVPPALDLDISNVEIFSRVRMSTWACGEFAMLPSGIPSSGVHKASDGFQVLWIYAASITAKMIKLKTFGHSAYKILEGKNVSTDLDRAMWRERSGVENTVALAVVSCSPKPTSRIRLWRDFFKKAFDRWSYRMVNVVGHVRGMLLPLVLGLGSFARASPGPRLFYLGRLLYN